MIIYLIIWAIKIADIDGAVMRTPQNDKDDLIHVINEIGNSDDYIERKWLISGKRSENRYPNYKNNYQR